MQLNTRLAGRRLCLAITVASLAIGLPNQTGAQARRPNIVLILADDLGREVLNSYGGTSYKTPHLDRLAASGIRFARAYSTPLCTPTRVQMMTGKYNFRNYEKFENLNPREVTFANLLKDAGYATAVSGKWQLGGNRQTPHRFGFDEYLLWQIESPDHNERYKDPIVTLNGRAPDTLPGRYGPDLHQDFVEDFIRRHRDGPFFVYYPMSLVHAPFQPTPDHPDYRTFSRKSSDTTYFAPMVSYMDGLVGRLVRTLDELGVSENTLVLFIGDNGTHTNIRSRMGDRVIQGGKGYSIDAGIHVPMIASWKGVIAPGQVHPELVDVVDFLPTLLDVAGVRPKTGFQTDGISFYPTLRSGTPHPRQWVFNDYHPGKEGTRPPGRWAHDKRYKLYSDGRFFDYVKDPLEQHPLREAELSEEARRARETLKNVMDRMEAEMRQVPPDRGWRVQQARSRK